MGGGGIRFRENGEIEGRRKRKIRFSDVGSDPRLTSEKIFCKKKRFSDKQRREVVVSRPIWYSSPDRTWEIADKFRRGERGGKRKS